MVEVAELSLSREAAAAEWLLSALEGARDEGARVALLDATAAVDPAALALAPRELAALSLFELPVVVAFEGALEGHAAEVALCADIRICGEAASLKGRIRNDARARTLTDEGTALALFLGRAPLTAEQLAAAGLVSRVTPAGGALAEARRLAAVIASRGPIATRLAKEAIWRGLPQPLHQALRFETDLTLLLQTTKDRAEGVRAFLEKRPPRFAGE